MIGSSTLRIQTPLQLTKLNAMGASYDLYPWIFNTGNLPREMSVTLLNPVSGGKRTIYQDKSAPCNRTYTLNLNSAIFKTNPR